MLTKWSTFIESRTFPTYQMENKLGAVHVILLVRREGHLDYNRLAFKCYPAALPYIFLVLLATNPVILPIVTATKYLGWSSAWLVTTYTTRYTNSVHYKTNKLEPGKTAKIDLSATTIWTPVHCKGSCGRAKAQCKNPYSAHLRNILNATRWGWINLPTNYSLSVTSLQEPGRHHVVSP